MLYGPQANDINDWGDVSIMSMNETSNNNRRNPIDCTVLSDSFNSDLSIENNVDIDCTESCTYD